MRIDRWAYLATLAVLAGCAIVWLTGCQTPGSTSNDCEVTVNPAPLTPSTFNRAIYDLGYHQSEASIIAAYGEPCKVGEDQWAKLLSYCMRPGPNGYEIIGKPNCPVPDVYGGNCDLELGLTFFKDPALLLKYGPGVGKVTFGALW